MWNLILGLIAVMGANIALGSSLAKLKEEFSKENLKRGLMKALMIISGLLLMLGCAYLNQDMIIASINNNNVTLLEAMKYLFTTGIMVYGIMDIGNENNILFYNDEEGHIRVEVLLENEDVWLNVEAIAKLFGV